MITELHTQPHPQQTTTNHNNTDYTQQQQQQTNNHNADNVRSITDSKKHGHQPNACHGHAREKEQHVHKELYQCGMRALQMKRGVNEEMVWDPLAIS